MTRGTFWQLKRALVSILLLCAIPMTGTMLSGSAQASGAYAVDDSDVTDPGKCGVDTWASFSARHDVIATTNPTCGIPFAFPLELSGKITRSNATGSWATSAAPQMKINFVPSGVGVIGVGIVGNVTYDFTTRDTTAAAIYVPVTLTPSDKLRINLNLGWLYDRTINLNWVTWGVHAEFSVTDFVKLIGEVYGQSGQSVRPTSTAWPEVQAGIRITPRDSFDIDLIYGRNITGENSNWITLGLNLRF